MTRRDLQGEAKKMGRPWEMGKAFDDSAPCTAAARRPAKIGHPAKGAIWLKVDGAVKQKGDLSELIWNIPETISYLSNLVTLQPGATSSTPARPRAWARCRRATSSKGTSTAWTK